MVNHVLWDQFDSGYMTTEYYAVAGFPELILTFVGSHSGYGAACGQDPPALWLITRSNQVGFTCGR